MGKEEEREKRGREGKGRRGKAGSIQERESFHPEGRKRMSDKQEEKSKLVGK
jgi:hypothetical protein